MVLKYLAAIERISDILPTALVNCSVIVLLILDCISVPSSKIDGIWSFGGEVPLFWTTDCPPSLDGLDGEGDNRPYWQRRPRLTLL